MERTLGIDVSFWQDDNNTPRQIDWKKSKTAGAVFAFIKAGQAAFTDSDFDFNWKESKNAGVLRGAYHFYDYRISPKTQVAHFIKLLKNEPGELPPVMDLEAHPNWPLPPRENLLAVIKTFLETLQTEFGRKPLFYTNPSMLYYTLKPVPSWLTEYPLWIAHYGVPQPTMIQPWAAWTFWQWTTNGDGTAFGMESKSLDMNWFNGSETDLRKWAGVEPGPTPPLTLEEKVARLWAAHPELH